ncbi:MAG: hypothetical protein BWY63_02501 [Chloroflexi bacterium ADurb.Bin360]|nr:MAG: hypothetical protein BWY63_02501 [Chloroflexi bacterium ADurb.Bin360]
MPRAWTGGVRGPPGADAVLCIQGNRIHVGLNHQGAGGEDAHTPENRLEPVELTYGGRVVHGAGFLGGVKGKDDIEQDIGNREGAAIVPGHAACEIHWIGDDAFPQRSHRLCIDLRYGEKALGRGIPICPGIAGNGYGRSEVQGHPIVGLAGEVTLLNGDRGAFNALCQRQAVIGTPEQRIVSGCANDRSIVKPVGAAQRVPGFSEKTNGGNGEWCTISARATQGVGPEIRAVEAAVEVRGVAHCGAAWSNQGAVKQPDADGIFQRQLERLHQQSALLLNGRKFMGA